MNDVTRYADMKDSGVEWLGQIPRQWEIKKLKYLVSHIESGVSVNAGQSEAKSDEYGVLKTSCVSRFAFDVHQNKSVNSDEIERLSCPVCKNTIIVSRMNTPDLVGACGYVNESNDRIFLPDRLWQVHFTNQNIVKYIFYFLSSSITRNYYASLSTGTSNSMQNISQGQFLNFTIAIPEYCEITKIVSYLDDQCAKIDDIIAGARTSIEEYKKWKASVIYEAVTKGLDPHAEMKDSGVEWIGKIPANWTISNIGSLYEIRNEKVSDKDFSPLSVTKNGILHQLETVAKTEDGDNRKLVCQNDFVINGRSDRRGSCGISLYTGSVSLINIVLKPKNEMNPVYYNWLFHAEMFSDEFYKWGRGIVDDLWTTRWSEMKKIIIPVPTISIQTKVASYLNIKCSEIDQLISEKEALIADLESYKKSLIYEVITGKRKAI